VAPGGAAIVKTRNQHFVDDLRRNTMAVTRLEIRSRTPYANGASFGKVGPYERVEGSLHFAVDPSHPANRRIVDLDKAPRDDSGRVSFRSDFCLLQPSEATQANRRLLFYVVNRGRQVVPFNRAPSEFVPTARLDPGDGFLMKRGWTVAWCGWQWDVMRRPELIGLEAPQAVDARGNPIQGQIIVQFQPSLPHRYQVLSHWPQHPPPGQAHLLHQPYPTADTEDPSAVLTVRDRPAGPRTVIARERWRFAREEAGQSVADDCHVWLEDGFKPGLLYEVIYRTRICPVVGTGLLAVRDCVTFLRHGVDGNPCAGQIDFAYGYGISQCGRFLREYLYQGLNVDEDGRQVFDGIIPMVAGARRGEFNQRFGQPSAQHVPSFGHLPPFADEEQTDPISGQTDGLLRRQRALGGVPKIFTINTSSEYWRSDCSLIHTDLGGERDVEPPSDVRAYLLAGSQHGPGALPLNDTVDLGARGANSLNTVDYSPLMRSLLVNFDNWVSAGVEPPSNEIPRLADGTAVRREDVVERFRGFGGVAVPRTDLLPVLRRIDLGPNASAGVGQYPASEGEPYPSYVSAVNEDGNEIAGIRLPDLTVPLASHAGWVPRHPSTGGEGQIVDMLGSTMPFAIGASERESRGDARPSIEERYRDRSDYLQRVRKAAEELITDRHLLAEDVDLVVSLAADRYDAFTRAPVSAT
jgi:hypothetical protein